MNEYRYNTSEGTFLDLKKKLKLDKAMNIAIAKAIIIPMIVYVIIYFYINPNSAYFALFTLMGTLIGLWLSSMKTSKTLEQIKSVNKIEWDENRIYFYSKEKLLKKWNRLSIELLEKNDNAVYLKMKSFTTIDYMAIPIEINPPKDLEDLYLSFTKI